MGYLPRMSEKLVVGTGTVTSGDSTLVFHVTTYSSTLSLSCFCPIENTGTYHVIKILLLLSFGRTPSKGQPCIRLQAISSSNNDILFLMSEPFKPRSLL